MDIGKTSHRSPLSTAALGTSAPSSANKPPPASGHDPHADGTAQRITDRVRAIVAGIDKADGNKAANLLPSDFSVNGKHSNEHFTELASVIVGKMKGDRSQAIDLLVNMANGNGPDKAVAQGVLDGLKLFADHRVAQELVRAEVDVKAKIAAAEATAKPADVAKPADPADAAKGKTEKLEKMEKELEELKKKRDRMETISKVGTVVSGLSLAAGAALVLSGVGAAVGIALLGLSMTAAFFNSQHALAQKDLQDRIDKLEYRIQMESAAGAPTPTLAADPVPAAALAPEGASTGTSMSTPVSTSTSSTSLTEQDEEAKARRRGEPQQLFPPKLDPSLKLKADPRFPYPDLPVAKPQTKGDTAKAA